MDNYICTGEFELCRSNRAMRFSVRSFGCALFYFSEGKKMKKKESAKRIAALLLALIMAALCCACSVWDDIQHDENSDETENVKEVHRDNDEKSDIASDDDTQRTDITENYETDGPSEPVIEEKTIRLEQCKSIGEIEFEKISFDNTGFVYFTSEEAALFPFKYKSQYGYINDKGEIIVRDQYDEAGIFSDGNAFVSKDSDWYVIDTNGEELFEASRNTLYISDPLGREIKASTDVPTWIYAGHYYDYSYQHSIPYYKNGYSSSSFIEASENIFRTYVRDQKNNVLVFDSTELFEDQTNIYTAPVFINNDMFTGIEVYKFYMDVINGSGTICKIYDLNGNLLTEIDQKNVSSPIPIVGGKYTKTVKNGKFAVVDFTTGNYLTDYLYDNIGYYSDGVIPVCNYDKWGLIDLDGNVLIKNKFEYLSAFSHGIGFALNTDGKGMLISKDGSVIAELPDEVLNGYSTNPFEVQEFTDNGFTFLTNSKTGKGYLITEKGDIIFYGDIENFKYISSNYVLYEDDLYKVIVE